MCGTKSRLSSLVSGRLSKALLVFLLSVFFAVMPLAAWWGAPEAIQETEVTSSLQTLPSTSCSNGTGTELKDLSQVLSQLQTGKKVTAEIYDQAVALKTELEAYFKLEEVEDAEEARIMKEYELNTALLAESNSKLEEENKTLQEKLDKAVRSKFFANVGALYSFKGKLGVSTNVGMRIGDGMMVSTGVQYMIGTLGDVAKIISDFNAEDLTASVTVGWEW